MVGDIRIGSPPSFASHHLLLAMQQFRLGAPDITFNLVLDDGSVDIVRESLDFSIRIAPILPDTALIARLLVKVPQVLVAARSEEHTSELQSLMRNSYAVFCLQKKIKKSKLH